MESKPQHLTQTPLINRSPPLHRDCNRDPSIKALKRRGCITQGSTLNHAAQDCVCLLQGRERHLVVAPRQILEKELKGFRV